MKRVGLSVFAIGGGRDEYRPDDIAIEARDPDGPCSKDGDMKAAAAFRRQ